MEKTDFLDRIARGLAARGLTEASVNKYVRRVGELLDELTAEERAAILSHDVDIDAFVSDLLRGSDEEGSATAKREAKPVQKPEARPVQKSEKPAVKTEDAPKSAKPSAEIKKAEAKSAPTPKKAAEKRADSTAKKMSRSEHAERAPTEEVPIPKSKKRKPEEEHRLDASKDYTRFWTIFVLTSPIWAFIMLAVALLFLAMIVTFAALSVVFVVLLIATVILGLALALVGIIYGAVQLFGGMSLPVGLFELGQGIFIGGLTTVLGVIFYNLSVRLCPWLIKQVARMFVSSARSVKHIFYVVRGALAK